MDCKDFIATRKASLEEQITALQTALIKLSSGAIQSYTLDTGQNRTVVTKYTIGEINGVLNSLWNAYVTLCARENGGATMIARPAF